MAARHRVALAVLTLMAARAPAETPPTAPDAAPWQHAWPLRPAEYAVGKGSLYLPMPDGVRLTVDVYLPTEAVAAGKRVPTLLVQTRYYRASALKTDPVGSCARIPGLAAYFTARGYALVYVDVRGSGASFGTRDGELGDREVADGTAIADWIVRQDWSSGVLGAFGQSYLGTSAELLARDHHPAVKAIAPISGVYDPYADLYLPGGILNATFREGWGALNRALDEGHPDRVALLAAVAGPCPVDGDTAALATATAQHAGNFDSAAATAGLAFRGDAVLPSPYRYVADLDRDAVPVLSIEGWQDSGYARSGIDRLINSRSAEQRLILAPGSHGVHFFAAPGVAESVPSAFDQRAELLAFFDHYLRGSENGYERSPKVRWFTTGANVWHAADTWPAPARHVVLCLGQGGKLATACPARTRLKWHAADAATGDHTRWNTTLEAKAVFLADRAAVDATLLTFTTAPLPAPLEVTGSPVLTLRIADVADDGDAFVYLEEVDRAGHVAYVGDGQIRASAAGGAAPYRTIAPMPSGLRRDRTAMAAATERTLTIALLPLSHRFAAGSRLRITLAGSDRAHFTDIGVDQRDRTLVLGPGASSLDLPVADEADRRR